MNKVFWGGVGGQVGCGLVIGGMGGNVYGWGMYECVLSMKYEEFIYSMCVVGWWYWSWPNRCG